jgi:FkbM family methyltransferase
MSKVVATSLVIFCITVFFPRVLFPAYYSQVGQDQFVREHFFKDLKKGIFVDIGAYDGVIGSNTYFFEKELGWTGVCIEPMPEAFDKLKKLRAAVCIQAAVAKERKKAAFLQIPDYADQLSGIIDSYHPAHLAKIRNCEKAFGIPTKTIEVECYPFNELMAQQGITHINFLSIDTEGNEYEILESIDWNKYIIDVITVEDNYGDPRFEAFLTSKGFELANRLSQDLIFVRKDFKDQLAVTTPN